jgi:hypothetical protein
MDIVITLLILAGVWVMLTVLGAERQRLLLTLQHQIAKEAEQQAQKDIQNKQAAARQSPPRKVLN